MKHKIMTMVMVGMMALAGSIALADAVIFDGTGAWPTSGDIEIPKGTTVTVSSADEVAAVAGWTSVKLLGSASTLVFANTTDAATFKATCSGPGVLKAEDSIGLTITGDNSALTGNWNISNSCVWVRHVNGLGSAATEAVRVYFGDEKSALHFVNPDSDVFTNNVAITYDVINNANYAGCVFGSESPDTYFVQNADFYQLDQGINKRVNFKNNFESIKGYFPFSVTKSNRGGHYYFNALEGARVVVSENSTLCLQRTIYGLGGNGTIVFNDSTPAVNTSYGQLAKGTDLTYVLGREGALGSTLVGYQVYLSTNPKGVFDLNGNDLAVSSVTVVYGQPFNESTTTYSRLTSATAAQLVVNGAYLNAVTAMSGPFKFEDKLGLAVTSGNVDLSLGTVVSDTTGDLTVSAGTLIFKWGAGWGGASGNVLVSGTGVLDINSVNAFKGNKKDLVVSDSGKIVVCNGAGAAFKSVKLGETTLEKRDYTVRELRENPATEPYVEGDNEAVISAGIETWEGWPIQPEPETVVPPMTVVDLTDADVANVAANVNKLVLSPGSVVNVSNANAYLALRAKITGSGTIRIVDSMGVALLGDNSGLTAPGHFSVENSALAVSNRYGLGSAATGAAEIKFASIDRKLVFGLADGLFCTNDVPLKLSATSGAVAWIGTESDDAHFVQNADVTLTGFTTYNDRMTYGGNVEFASGTFKTGGSLYFSGSLSASIAFGADCTVTNATSAVASLAFYGAGWNVGMDAVSRVYFGPKSFDGFSYFFNSTSFVRFTAPNVFANTPNLKFQYNTSLLAQKGRGVVDFCGYDELFGQFSNYSATQQGISFMAVTSGVPATVTLQTTSTALVRDSLEFQGQLGYHYAGAGTNLLCNMNSTSVGEFKVSSGVAGFDWGATWAGTNVVVSGTGTLYVGADSAAAGVFGAASGAKKSATVLTVGADGRLSLESGETVVFTASKGGEGLARGVYCATDNFMAKMMGGIPVDWIDGEGTLRVLKGTKFGLLLIFK